MKKAARVSASFVCALLLCAFLPLCAFAAASAASGDVNNDGKLNARDIVLVMKAAMPNFTPPANFVSKAADMNGDGKINARDVILVMKEVIRRSIPVLNTGVSAYSDEYNAFLSGAVFLGDSICKGISGYGFLPADNVVAENSVAAYNVFDFDFGVRGTTAKVTDALMTLNPANVVVFMGMNDTWRRLDAFIADYGKLVDAVREAVPNAAVYVATITPVGANCTYTTNAIIDSFNAALKNFANQHGCGFADVSSVLKGSDNNLSSVYLSSDGLHPPRSAYPVILNAVCRQIVG